jgi:hypothetical protein
MNGAQGDDIMTMKLAASNGAIQWRVHTSGPAALADRGFDIVVGPDGNPVVTGVLSTATDPAYFCTVKLRSSNGGEIWNRKILGAVNNIYTPGGWLAVCDNGDIVMGNRTWSASTTYDVVLQRYAASSGGTVWAIQYNSSGTVSDNPNDMTRDVAGDLLVAGERAGNFMVLKFDRGDGHLLWSAIYNGPANGYDAAGAVVEGPGGCVVATGFSTGSGTSWDVTTAGFDPADGTRLWTERYDAGDHLTDEGNAVAVSPLGDIYVAGLAYKLVTEDDMLALRYCTTDPTGVAGGRLDASPFLAFAASPNPFTGTVAFSAELFGDASARVAIYDPSGRLAGVLHEGALTRGAHAFSWDGRDAAGRPAAPGVYFARLEAGDAVAVRKIVLSR